MKVFAAALTLLFLFSSPGKVTPLPTPDENGNIVQEYVFEGDSRSSKYTEAPREIEVKGKVYYRGDINYEVMEEKETIEAKTFERQEPKEGMYAKDDKRFPESIEVDSDGYKGTIERKRIVYVPRKVTGRTVKHEDTYDYGYQTYIPEPLPILESLYYDKHSKCEVLAPLTYIGIRQVEDWHWEDNFTAEQLYKGIDADTYFLRDRTSLSFDAEKPEYEGIEDRLLAQMRLDPEHYQIIDSKWLTKKTKDGNVYSRQALYIMKRYVARYVASYSGTIDIPNILVYDATAFYEGELERVKIGGNKYTIKATVTYTPEPPNNTWKWITGGCAVVLCGLVFLLIYKKRKKDQKVVSEI